MLVDSPRNVLFFNRDSTICWLYYTVYSLSVYSDSILSAGYIPTITLPTRLSENSTIIDNIFTTNLDNNISACRESGSKGGVE